MTCLVTCIVIDCRNLAVGWYGTVGCKEESRLVSLFAMSQSEKKNLYRVVDVQRTTIMQGACCSRTRNIASISNALIEFYSIFLGLGYSVRLVLCFLFYLHQHSIFIK